MIILKKIKHIGPGAIVAAAFIGPGTITTATLAGSTFGYTLLWAIVFSVIATFILQEMAARLGLVARIGIGQALRVKTRSPILKIMGSLLIISAILIGNSAYEAGNITGAALGFGSYFNFSNNFNPLILPIGFLTFLLLFTGKYKIIERVLIVLVGLMSLVFLTALVVLKPNLWEVFRQFFQFSLPKDSAMMVLALIGTTVVPYNLFLHAATVQKKWTSTDNLTTSRWDTLISVSLGGLITMAIAISAAAVLQAKEQNFGISLEGVDSLNFALAPLLGHDGSQLFIAFGFFAAGLSSSITAPLAAAFATSELLGWKSNLTSIKFRFIWIFVLVIGIIFSSLNFKPTSVILFSQMANGLLLPIIAIFLVWIMNDKKIMKQYTNLKLTNVLAFFVILITIALGLKSLLTAIL